MDRDEAIDNPYSVSTLPVRRAPSSGHIACCPVEPSSDSLIGEGELRRAFEQIASSIHLDEDDEQLQHDCSINGKTTVPEARDPRLPSSPSTSRISLTPKSSPNTVSRIVGTPVTPASSPLTRMGGGRSVGNAGLCINSPLPVMSSLSFLDDDWLKERVKHDSKMAQVAGGLVRTASITPPAEPTLAYGLGLANLPVSNSNVTGAAVHPSGSTNCHLPPGDYVCKLCNIPGHWLKDCHLFEPRPGNKSLSSASSSRAHSISKVQQQAPPPGNYVCRLCGVPGHWIEQCSKFQPKRDLLKGGAGTGVPPRNYICNLCHQPGHWIQQCSEFTPMPGYLQYTRRSSSLERGGPSIGHFF